MRLKEAIAQIEPLSAAAAEAARERQLRLTKPTGALGHLESLSIQLAGITGNPRPVFRRSAIVVAAASHGIAAEEPVSAYPASVTAQMVQNFIAGGAAINVLARQMGAELVVVDAGVEPEVPSHPKLRRARGGGGTRNMLRGPAMPRHDAEQIVEIGVQVTQELADSGIDLIALGEMGIGNTTAAAAIVATVTGAPVEAVTGRGTLIDDARLAHKCSVIASALALHRPAPDDPLGVLSAVGGYEIGFLAGCCIGAAMRRIPIVLDGYITSAAALLAVGLGPQVRSYLVAGHRSAEPGHRIALQHLGLRALLDLDLRLGEGSGAALALPIVIAAARTLDEMATFQEASVDDKDPA
jgi:nicotinate-nucleotide--dimethylbenzimidazole phosphoribosyltransferase